MQYGETGFRDSFVTPPDPGEFRSPAFSAPDWLRHAVIMELPIRGFNHPAYRRAEDWQAPCGDASYLSIIGRLAFLKDSGINVLCLYSIYHHTRETNLYAIRHHDPHPDLGTLDDVKRLIREAHAAGMHVISNTNHYGVDESSPMLAEHPEWFLGREHILYDQPLFDLNNPEAVQYIIDTHAWWCTEVGLDGWRIDVAGETYRSYIWNAVLETCTAAGKQILLATENAHLEGHIRGAGWETFPTFFDMKDPMPVLADRASATPTLQPYASASAGDPYRVKDISSHNSMVPAPYNAADGDHAREGAYQLQGSRFLFGHNLMFAPFVPWMMHGELFNATHLGVPGVLGCGLQGKLLHCYLDWDDLDEQRDVITDFRKISQVRDDNSDIFHNNLHDSHVVDVPCTADPPSRATPYARFIPGNKAAIVIGNELTDQDVTFTLNMSLDELGLADTPRIQVSDLWTGTTELVDHDRLQRYQVVVPRDKAPRGGVRVLMLTSG